MKNLSPQKAPSSTVAPSKYDEKHDKRKTKKKILLDRDSNPGLAGPSSGMKAAYVNPYTIKDLMTLAALFLYIF